MPVKIEVAEPKERFVAAAIDFVPIFVVFIILVSVGLTTLATLWAIAGSLYFIVRDLIGNGQSFGKRFTSLQVVDAETDRVPDPMALVLRNLGFGVPVLNVIYAVVEGVQVIRHPQHLRWGDMFASTGVVKVPAEDREKLLERKVSVDRPSGRGKVAKEPTAGEAAAAPDPTAATATSAPPAGAKAATPAAAPRPASSAPKAAPGAAPARGPVSGANPRPTGGGAVPAAKPAATPSASGARPAGAAPARKPGAAIDLPPDTSKPAAAAKPAAPKPEAQGIDIDPDDPLKKLIDSAQKRG